MKSIYSGEYQLLLGLLVQARKEAKITQEQLAERLKRPHSFVSKVERGERRLDVVEFLKISRLIKADPYAMLYKVESRRRKG